MNVELIALTGIPEVGEGDALADLIAAAIHAGPGLADHDILVVAQKVVSKSEGALRRLSEVVVTPQAAAIAGRLNTDPRRIQVVLDESVRIVREQRVLIVETRHGYICANAGVDHSNVPGTDTVSLLPRDCDASARHIRSQLGEQFAADIAVIVSDTFGRPWRNGVTNVALGVAGMAPLEDLRGGHDDNGEALTATIVATADELAAAAGLVMGKTARAPAVLIRGVRVAPGDRGGAELLRPAVDDLFR